MDEKEFDLESVRSFLLHLKKQWFWIVSATVLGFVICYLISGFVLPKRYTSSVSLYVNNLSGTAESGDVELNNLNASQKLADTCIVILQDDDVLLQVSEKLSKPMSVKALDSVVSMNSVNDTEVLQISATTEDPAFSAEICNVMTQVAPSVLERVVKAGSVEVIGEARPAQAPSAPNVQRNAVLGAICGLLLSVGIAFLAFVTDNTVKSEEDLKQHLDVPVLGEIPSFSSRKGNKHVQKK